MTYELFRDGGTTPIYTTTFSGSFYQRPMLGYTDTGLAGLVAHLPGAGDRSVRQRRDQRRVGGAAAVGSGGPDGLHDDGAYRRRHQLLAAQRVGRQHRRATRPATPT